MTACRFPDVNWIKKCTLQKQIGRFVFDPRIESAENTANAHSLRFVANHQVFFIQRAFHFIQGTEFCTCRESLDKDLLPFYSRQIEGVEWLPRFKKHIIGDVHDIVDWFEANHTESVFQPVG